MLPPDTLVALRAAVIESPADRAVRLVYADALEENGDPADLPLVEFIRGQIALESMADDNPSLAALEARCAELFSAGWLGWWDASCVAAGLPRPFVPKRGSRAKRTRPTGHPYERIDAGLAVRDTGQDGFAATFGGGFPEAIRLGAVSKTIPKLLAAVPLDSLAIDGQFDAAERARLDGPHLARLRSLHFDRFDGETLHVLAASPHLRGLTRLSLKPRLPSHVRVAVSGPTWADLAELHLLPEGNNVLDVLATHCRLSALRSLTLTVGSQGSFRSSEVLASPMARRLTRFRLNVELGRIRNTALVLFLGEEVIRDLRDGFDPHALESLELPAWAITDAQRRLIAERWGDRLRLTPLPARKERRLTT